MSISEDEKKRAAKIFSLLKKTHPDATIELKFKNPLELMVATILSAQCTDYRVNEVTATLFKRYRTPKDYAAATDAELEKAIKSTGFFRQKAKSIKRSMQILLDQYGGKLPRELELLTELPGIGRKTANVILGNAFGIPGLPVDTHVKRVSNRLGLTDQQDPIKIERDLNALIPRRQWIQFSHTLIFHGRRICKARTPLCSSCPVSGLCRYFKEAHRR